MCIDKYELYLGFIFFSFKNNIVFKNNIESLLSVRDFVRYFMLFIL